MSHALEVEGKEKRTEAITCPGRFAGAVVDVVVVGLTS